jgi:hypothetical protein
MEAKNYKETGGDMLSDMLDILSDSKLQQKKGQDDDGEVEK